MKILMIEIPSSEHERGGVPFGLFYAASAAKRLGHDVLLLDLTQSTQKMQDIVDTLNRFNPNMVGLGGITSGYKFCKKIIAQVKQMRPDLCVIVGGVITSISDLLLEKTGADYIIHGEAESVLPDFLKSIEKKERPISVKGISYLSNGKIVKTSLPDQIQDMDQIPFPDYSLLKMDEYLSSADDWVKWYFDDFSFVQHLWGKKLFQIVTARGCTHRCIFCYRHHRGIRQHSPEYVVRHMKYLKENFNVGLFQINDELTTSNSKWVHKFCDLLLIENLNTSFIVLSARVDNVDEEMLLKLKSAGCVNINYGYESGSPRILKDIRKGVTLEQALKTALLTKKVGLKNVPEIIIGFPNENETTINETIDFLKKINTWPISTNFPIPFPETPLWDIAMKKGLIKDKEEFVLGYKRGLFLNFTNFSDQALERFGFKVRSEVKLHYLITKRKFFSYIHLFLYYKIYYKIKLAFPNWLISLFKKVNANILSP